MKELLSFSCSYEKKTVTKIFEFFPAPRKFVYNRFDRQKIII